VFEAGNGDLYLVSGSTKLVVFSGEKVVATHQANNMVVGLAEDAHGVVASVGRSLYREAPITSRLTFLPTANPSWNGFSTWQPAGTERFGSPAGPEFFASKTAPSNSGRRRRIFPIRSCSGFAKTVTVLSGGRR
jgi:hypothetical protein